MYFDVIQDTRFSPLARENVIAWVKDIAVKLHTLPLEYHVDMLRELYFDGKLTEHEPCTSHRQRFYIKKTGRISWDTIQKTVNNIKICRFDFLKCVKV